MPLTSPTVSPTKRYFIISLVAGLLLAACGGEHKDEKKSIPAPISADKLSKIDHFVQNQMTRQHIPGLALVVTMDGKPVLEKGYGVTVVSTKAPVTPASVFQIGSVTKQFTATGVMLLVQEGRVNLDHPIRHYFPSAPATWAGITVRHLLQHTSGLFRGEEHPEIFEFGKALSMDQKIALFGQFPLNNPPGNALEYSNIGYVVLGMLIEKVSGQYYADFLRQRVFAPLKMDTADIIFGSRSKLNLATGYVWRNDTLTASDDSYMIFTEAAGNLQMSAQDLAKWDAALRTELILSKQSVAQMWAPARLNDGSTVAYGFGWVLGEINHRPFTWHNGTTFGFSSHFERHTNEGLSIIVLTNNVAGMPSNIPGRIAAIIKPELDWVTTSDPQPKLGTLVRAIYEEALQGKLMIDGRFGPEIRAAMTPEDVAAFTANAKDLGKIERFGYIDQIKIEGGTVSRYLVQTESLSMIFSVQLDAEGRLTVFDYST